jgi:hypothetical protein
MSIKQNNGKFGGYEGMAATLASDSRRQTGEGMLGNTLTIVHSFPHD